MKNRLWIYIFIIVVIGLLFWLRSKHETTISQQPPETVQMNNQSSRGAIITQQPVPNTSLVVTSSTNFRPFATNHPNVTEALERFVESRNKPIDFYGRFIDQNSNSIADVNITINIKQVIMPVGSFQGYVDSKYISIAKTSDADGRFELHDEKGENFGFGAITKNGYVLSSKAPRGFGGSIGTYDDPIIFKMQKTGESQKLISHYLSRIGIPVDGQPVQFDLFNGAKVPSDGQLIVHVERNPQILPPGNVGYDWTAEFEIPNGGMVTNNDEFMYQAPENGYQETYKVEMPKDARNWTTTLNQQFYILLPNGDYGNLTVHLPTFHSPPLIVLTLGITINPNGSRNLQP